MTHSRILLAQYSLVHHSTRRLRVSRPTEPPSESDSLAVDAMERAGDGILDGVGEEATLLLFEGVPLASLSSLPFAFRSLPACDKLSRLPLPNFRHTCPSRLRCLLTWYIRHMSDWRFFLCSESTALSSRDVHDGEKSGEWKKAAKRARAGARAGVETVK
jgi:hypothetical protein